MSIIKKDATETIRLAQEVIELATEVVGQIDRQESYDYEAQQIVQKYDGAAPDMATHPGYSKTTAALNRRSLDLTRQLAKLRKGNLQ
jgi:hypothetical protein